MIEIRISNALGARTSRSEIMMAQMSVSVRNHHRTAGIRILPAQGLPGTRWFHLWPPQRPCVLAFLQMEYSVFLQVSLPLLHERFDDYVQEVGNALPDLGLRWRLLGMHLIAETVVGDCAVYPLLQCIAGSIRAKLAGAVVIQAGPDVMTLADMSTLVGLPHGSLEALREEYHESFPRPTFGDVGRWHLLHVLRWVRAVGAIHVDPRLLDVASACEQFNATLRIRRAGRWA